MRRAPATPRQIVFEALKAAAPQTFDDERRHAFLAGSDLDLSVLDLDSLAKMEFCIAIELASGVTLLPSELAGLSTSAIEQRLREAASALDGSR